MVWYADLISALLFWRKCPGSSRHLAQVWLNRALFCFDSEYALSVKDCQKATEFRSEGREPRLESADIVAFYRGLVEEARAALEDKCSDS